MTKEEQVTKLAKETGLTKAGVQKFLTAYYELFVDDLKQNGRHVSPFGLGSYKVVHCKATRRFCPSKKQLLDIPECNVVRYTRAKRVKDIEF